MLYLSWQTQCFQIIISFFFLCLLARNIFSSQVHVEFSIYSSEIFLRCLLSIINNKKKKIDCSLAIKLNISLLYRW